MRLFELNTPPGFMRWFAGSKCVNPNGSPKKMYHGTSKGDIRSFDITKSSPQAWYGPGFYFTDSPEVAGGVGKRRSGGDDTEQDVFDRASWNLAGYAFQGLQKELTTPLTKRQLAYAWRLLNSKQVEYEAYSDIGSREAWIRAHKAFKAGEPKFREWLANESPRWLREKVLKAIEPVRTNLPTVYPVYLSIKNPFDMNEDIGPNGLRQLWRALGDRRPEPYEDAVRPLMNDVITGHAAWIWLRDTLKGDKVETNRIIAELGFDGIHHEGGNNVGTFGNHDVWIAFYPNQIKSIHAKEFDPNSPNIDEDID